MYTMQLREGGGIWFATYVHERFTVVSNQYQTSTYDVNLINEIEGTVIGTAIVGTAITGLIYIYIYIYI